MDDALLQRLLAPEHLMAHLAPGVAVGDARLLAATPRAIDAPGYLSDLVGVTLAWTALQGPPKKAVLKVSHPGFGREELPFYRDIAPRLRSPVLPRFFAGGHDDAADRTWILMQDLSASHERPSDAPVPPNFDRSARIVEALARFHAAGWENDALAGLTPTLLQRLRASDWLEDGVQRLFAQAGDAIDSGTREAYARWLRAYPALVERAAAMRGWTLAHGDAHPWNWMLPRPGSDALPQLIDWDNWHLGLGVWDLAYMLALQSDRDVRLRFEAPLLDHYHAALVEAGVHGYSRENLRQDYRVALLLHLRTPVARFVRRMSAYVWWPQLRRIRHAVADQRCLELLD